MSSYKLISTSRILSYCAKDDVMKKNWCALWWQMRLWTLKIEDFRPHHSIQREKWVFFIYFGFDASLFVAIVAVYAMRSSILSSLMPVTLLIFCGDNQLRGGAVGVLTGHIWLAVPSHWFPFKKCTTRCTTKSCTTSEYLNNIIVHTPVDEPPQRPQRYLRLWAAR